MNISELSGRGRIGRRCAVVLLAALAGACTREGADGTDRRPAAGSGEAAPGASVRSAEPNERTATTDPAGTGRRESGTLSERADTGSAPPADAARANDPPAAPTGLVDVLGLDSTFVLDVRYATPRNFTGRTLYPVARCLLRADAAERLVRVHERLRREGLRLRLFDCYRPLSIQRVLWELVPDERYVANPAQGSRHNRGAAVDLTLADASGRALPMPTEYDSFTERAHRDWTGGDPAHLANRDRLEAAMTAEGFEPLPTEWWHFDAPGWERHAVLDVPLSTGDGPALPSRGDAERAAP
jgi:D-alanyl-D-alanine dipeptidase